MQQCVCRQLVAVAIFFFTCSLQAAPITFNFVFQANPPSMAKAVGSITFESTLISNPGNNVIDLPDASVLGLNVTVSGASSGNGNFTLADFASISFDIPSTLDFSQELVGQFTTPGPWATNCNGDFNLFNASGSPAAPNGEDCFDLGADGDSADEMFLTSMISSTAAAAATPTPATSLWALSLLAMMLALGGALGMQRFRGNRR